MCWWWQCVVVVVQRYAGGWLEWRWCCLLAARFAVVSCELDVSRRVCRTASRWCREVGTRPCAFGTRPRGRRCRSWRGILITLPRWRSRRYEALSARQAVAGVVGAVGVARVFGGGLGHVDGGWCCGVRPRPEAACVRLYTFSGLVVLGVRVVGLCGGGAEVRGRVAGVAVVLSVGCALCGGFVRA